jgi:hypothetical protein
VGALVVAILEKYLSIRVTGGKRHHEEDQQ